MLNIYSKLDGTKLTLVLDGELNTNTAPDFEKEINSSIEGLTDLVLDFGRLEYISSAGLRVLLYTQQVMEKQGTLTVRGVNESIRKILDTTGFTEYLNIE